MCGLQTNGMQLQHFAVSREYASNLWRIAFIGFHQTQIVTEPNAEATWLPGEQSSGERLQKCFATSMNAASLYAQSSSSTHAVAALACACVS